MIIDAHAHACGDYLNAHNILKILDQNKADKVILVPGEFDNNKNYSLPDVAKRFPNKDMIYITNVLTKIVISLKGTAKQISKGNEYVYSLTQKSPGRIIQFYWVMLNELKSEDELDTRLKQWDFKGIKLHQCWESFNVRSDKFVKVVKWAERNNLPIFIHLYSKKEVLELISYIEENPKTKFIIAHLFGLEYYMKSGNHSENVYFEISAPPLISIKRLQKAIEHFGAHKIILGSDTPYGKDNLKMNIQRIRSLPIPGADKKLILGENIQKLLT
jgi:predicted TIM-barrel fold metal-dependent hydrolase